jgi:hypothetical protein
VNNAEKGVRVAAMKKDPTPGDEVFNPGHPHADERGMVRLPNVQIATEMVDLMSASRAYEARTPGCGLGKVGTSRATKSSNGTDRAVAAAAHEPAVPLMLQLAPILKLT